MIQTPADDRPQALHEIKGVLTKFMRMLFPLEFRFDSIANSRPDAGRFTIRCWRAR